MRTPERRPDLIERLGLLLETRAAKILLSGLIILSVLPYPELETTLRAAFDVENPKVDEWVVTFTLEFLDKDGKLIDRAVDKEEFEGESKVYKVDHAILEYVVPMIDKVRIKLEARYD